MKKSTGIIVAVIVVIGLGVGAYAIFHSSSSTSSTNNPSPTPTSQPNASHSVNNAVVITKTDPKLGEYLTDPSGRALYTYKLDTSGVSNCTGSCLANWPAYTAKASTTNLPANVSTITRSDNNQMQYTYNGMPLYYFTSDSQGQVTGNGVENFAVAKPASSTQASPTPSPTPTPPSNNSYNSGKPY
jgi:predicted lipoprotein with Yx(FWY)xxD motif